MGREDSWVEFDVPWLVHAMHITERCRDAEVRGHGSKGLLHCPDLSATNKESQLLQVGVKAEETGPQQNLPYVHGGIGSINFNTVLNPPKYVWMGIFSGFIQKPTLFRVAVCLEHR